MQPQEWNEAVRPLFGHLPPLHPEAIWNAGLDAAIAGLTADDGGGTDQLPYAMAVKSGLHLWNGSMNASHELSQNIHNQTGSFWHGIMHRMEGDYGNAKYWFRQVGRHPVYSRLPGTIYPEVREWLAANPAARLHGELELLIREPLWEPYRWVDIVEREVTGEGESEAYRLLLLIQRREMAELLAYSLQQCGGGGWDELAD